MLTPLFDPSQAGRPMRVAGFLSGSGTNIQKLIDHQKRLQKEEGSSPFEVVFLFSDRSDGASQGETIAFENGLFYISNDVRSFHRLRGLRRTVTDPEGITARKKFDAVAERLVKSFDIDVIALGGYMSYITLNSCINVHPADLSIFNRDGQRKYVGDHAVMDAIAAGETELRSSTLWTDEGMDTGPLLMVSDPVKIKLSEPLNDLIRDKLLLGRVAAGYQERLKEIGDWKIFPRTVELIARGRFEFDEENRVYLDGQPVPHGYRESE